MENQEMGATGTTGATEEAARIIVVTIRSIMERGDLAQVTMRTDSTVRELKMACHSQMGPKVEQQAFVFDGKQLKDDDKTLAEYGMTGDCVVQLTPRLASGLRDTRNLPTDSNVILISPHLIPQSAQSLADLREAIKGLHTTLPSKLKPEPKPEPQHWTPEKQMEHELTRNRMKQLMQRRKKVRQAKEPPVRDLQPEAKVSMMEGIDDPSLNQITDSGSICGSIGRSPMLSEPSTPPELRRQSHANHNNNQNNNNNSSPSSNSPGSTVARAHDPASVPVTVTELKVYFDPPETFRQSEALRRDLYDPPQNREELARVKKNIQELQKRACGVCRRRLPPVQQSMKCRCGKVFCARHRNAEEHKCSVDYKLAGRKKLEKEIPKIELGGARKAKPDET